MNEYPTIVGTLVAINDLSQQGRIASLLQEYYSMTPQDAQAALVDLPFKLPVSFFTLDEGRKAVRQLEGLGCVIKFRDMLDPEPEEEVVPEPVEVQPAAPVVEERQPRTTAAPAAKRVAKKRSGVDHKLLLWGSAALALLVVVLLLWLFIEKSGDSTPSKRVESAPGSVEDSAIFHTPFLKKLSVAIEKKLNQMRPIDQFLKDLSRQLDQNQVTEPDREKLSNHYAKRAKQPRKRDDSNIRTMRSIKMLGIALAINNKNRTAWTQLVDAYQSKGMSYRVKKTQLDMMEQLGEETMIELYGEAVVQELLKP